MSASLPSSTDAPADPALAAATTPWRREILDVGDADAHAASLAGWQQCYDQVSPGAYRGSTVQLALGDLQLFRERSSRALRQRGRPSAGMHNFAICSGAGALFRHRRFEAGSLLVMAAGTELDLRTPEGFEAFGIDVAPAVLAAAAGGDGRPGWTRHDVLCMPAGVALRLRERLRHVFDTAAPGASMLGHPAARRAFCDELLEDLVATLEAQADEPCARTVRQHARIVARSEDFVLSRPFESVTVGDLCERVGTSRRRLQYAFRNVAGVSPNQYLRAIRLCQVRRELKAAQGQGAVVQDSAARWGFWHLGHFARDYRRMFGERPSDTLNASRPGR